MGGSASAHASAIGSQPAGYGGSIGTRTGTGIANESGSLVSPSIATYTANTAVRTERSFAAVAVLAGAIILVP